MNSKEIRAEAIDRLAQAHYRQVFSTGKPWAELPPDWRDSERRVVTFLVDALGDMLPTGVETRELEDGYCGQSVSRTGEVTGVSRPSTKRQRYVTGWQGWPSRAAAEWTVTVGGGDEPDPPQRIDVTTVPPGAIERMRTSGAGPSPALREAIERARQRRGGGSKP